MTGGLIQLASYGGADIYITGNPEITYFKTVYRRHTNFAKESIIQHIDGRVGYGRTVNIDITRAGDLLGPIWLQLRPPFFKTANTWYYTQGLGNALVKRVDLVIGGQLIDRQYGEWMAIWEELSVSTGRRPGLDAMTLTNVPMASLKGATVEVLPDPNPNNLIAAPYLNVPLQFWFCRNPALALPLVAMSLHEVRLQLEFGSMEDITGSYVLPTSASEYGLIVPEGDDSSRGDMNKYTSGLNMECEVWATYFHLDSDERRQLTQAPLEYLIEIVQHKGAFAPAGGHRNLTFPAPDPTPNYPIVFDVKNIKYDLGFANPVKELVWGIRPLLDIPASAVSLYPTYRTRARPSFAQFWGQFDSAVIRFNSQERMKDRSDDHFLLTQNYQHHTRVPRYNKLTGSKPSLEVNPTGSVYSNRIYTYSFGLNPEQYQPSGAANFSKLDDATLEIRGISINDPLVWSDEDDSIKKYFNGLELVVYATSYNILRVKDGMCGLAFDA